MWEQIDETLAKEQGLEKGVAFARSVETRCGLKRPSACPYLILDPTISGEVFTNQLILQVPDDIAAMVSFLAGPGSRNITGQAMIVDGGKCLPASPKLVGKPGRLHALPQVLPIDPS